ncbi:MAG: AAA family ATPase [Planctomycetes bacterium]|jgi:adenylate kinase|nr:AAA family ATPase [Planctomycetota bacterium]
MKVVVTGQVGLDKKPFLQRVVEIAREQGHDLTAFNVGEKMYAEAPDVAPGKILDLPLARLDNLRRSVFKDIIAASKSEQNILVNTHATFRWNHGLFFAFDHDQMLALDADLYIVLLDSIDRVAWRLRRDGHRDHSLKDLMVWREEEVLATELLSRIASGHGKFYICVRGDDLLAETMVRLMFRPRMKRAYLSFPMSHVMDMPDVLKVIEDFRRNMKRYFTCFDPADMEHEKPMTFEAIDAAREGHRTMTVGHVGERIELDVQEVMGIIPDIDGQIYVRDFKLIDQADMIVSLVPECSDGKPAISSGVERELHHAHESTRDVFVVWLPRCEPSPFITETCTKVFHSADEALRYFQDNGYVEQQPDGSLFQ